MIRPLIICTLIAAGPVLAMDPTASAPAIPCPDRMKLDWIAEPWDINIATYGRDDVQMMLLDLVEPADASFQLAILHPPRDELGRRQCHLIAPQAQTGFPGFIFEERSASYNPETGLTVSMPIQLWNGETPDEGWAQIFININQQTGEVRYQAFD